MPMPPKYAAQETLVSPTRSLRSTAERRVPRRLRGILFPFVHLFLELFCLFLVHEGQSNKAVFGLERVEECAILVVVPGIVDLLIPYHASASGGNVNQLDPVRVSDQVIGQHHGALQARIAPSCAIRVRGI